MAITAAEILFKLSTGNSGSAGNASAQGNVNASLGKFIATTQVTDASLNNLFDDLTGDENAQGGSYQDYRCIFVHNSNASLTLQNAVMWLSAEVAGGAVIAIGVDPAAASAIGSGTQQGAVITTDTSAPAGVTFSAPTTKGTGIALGNIPAGQCRAIWIRRTAANTSALNNDGATVRVEGDTAA